MQETFSIANLKVNFEAKGDMLYTRSRAYLTDYTDKPDFSLHLSEETVEARHKTYPQLTLDECRYMWMGEQFYYGLIHFGGLLMHASCVARNGKAYLFSAKSGTGKSTHTALWMRRFADCTMINDDKPALRKLDGKFYACGTPFSGKDDASTNICVPIRAIVFLERGTKNSIEPITPLQAIPLFLSQTLRPSQQENMTLMLDILGDLLEHTPVFRLRCTMDEVAAQVSYDGIEQYYKALEKESESHEN